MGREKPVLPRFTLGQELFGPYDIEFAHQKLSANGSRPAISFALDQLEPAFAAYVIECRANCPVFFKFVVPIVSIAAAQADRFNESARRIDLPSRIDTGLLDIKPNGFGGVGGIK